MSPNAASSSGRVCADSRSTSWPSRAAPGEVSALAVGRGAPAEFGGERAAGGGEPGGQPRIGSGAEVVGVGDEQVPEAAVEQGVEQTGGVQGGVDVAVTGRAPFQGRGRPAS